MTENTPIPEPWPFQPGEQVTCGLQFDQDEALDAAPVGTVVQNAEGCEWTRGVHGWLGAHPSWATSADLVEHGPLTVVSVPGDDPTPLATGGTIPDCCDHSDMEQGHCHACYDTGHTHAPTGGE